MFLSTLGPMATDIYLSSMPAIAHDFNEPIRLIEYSLPAFTLGYSIGAPIHGALSDRVGRKLVILICLIIGFIGGVVATYSHDAMTLIIGRIIQGVGFSGTVVLARTIIRDIATDQIDIIKNASLLASLSSIITALAPLVGGYIQTYFFWQLNFIILTVLPLILIVITINKLPETILHKHRYTLMQILYNYKKIITNRKFLLYNLISSLTLNCLILYQAVSPYILQQQVGITPTQYGSCAVILALALALGSNVNNRLIAHFGRKKMYYIGCGLLISSGVLYCIFDLLNQLTLYTVLIPICITCFSSGILFPNSSSGAMTLFSSQLGSASAMYSFLQMSSVSILCAIILKLFDHDLMALGSVFIISAIIIIFANIQLHKR